MNYFNFNGKILEEGTTVIGPANRGLRYGDGLFETMKYKDGRLILAGEHFARLWKGMKLLKFDIPKLLSPENLEKEIVALLLKNKHTNARIRLTVTRGNAGLYDAENHSPLYIIQSWPLETGHSTLNENGLQLCIYKEAKKIIDSFSNIKHNNYLPYFMGALYAKEQRCNDAVILNALDRVCDSTIANIFVIKDEIIYTPCLHEGCIAGVMRNFVIRELSKQGYPVTETGLSTASLLEADEVFLSNSIYNIRWVAVIEEKKYSNSITGKIFDALHKTNPAVFC